jgi:carboxyl-terminal processing protease
MEITPPMVVIIRSSCQTIFMNLRPITLVGIVVSMVTGIALGITVYRAWLDQGAESPHAKAFDAVLSHVHAHYVDDVEKDELVRNALRGMLGELDDYSLFLDSGDYHELQADTTGRFGGIGIEVGLEDEYFTVVAPMDGTPAERAGLQSGDRILEVDHESLKGRKLVEVVDQLRGEAGTDVHLRIQRDDAPRDVSLTRTTIEVTSVQGRLLEPGYAYVRISQFQSGTGAAFESTVKKLRQESNDHLEGLVLDLRNNPGGVLQACVSVADALLEEGLIVYTEGRLPSSKRTYRATKGDVTAGASVVVLVNGGTASASEIVAGALKDHGRATLMGARSYGKGSVQSVMPLASDQAIKLTTAYYFTPNGRSIHRAGIEPDLARERGDESPDAYETRLVADALTVLKQSSADRLHARL